MNSEYDYVVATVAATIKDLESEKDYLINRLIVLKDCSVCQLNNCCYGSYDGCFTPIEDGVLVKQCDID